MDRPRRMHRAVYSISALLGLVVLTHFAFRYAPCQPVFPMLDMVDNLADVQNRDGTVATVRRTRAALLSVDTPIPYYVFVHQQGIPERSCNLVFQYDTTDRGWRDAPHVTWNGRSSLRVAVADERDIARIVQQRTMLNGIQVTYVIARPRSQQRGNRR